MGCVVGERHVSDTRRVGRHVSDTRRVERHVSDTRRACSTCIGGAGPARPKRPALGRFGRPSSTKCTEAEVVVRSGARAAGGTRTPGEYHGPTQVTTARRGRSPRACAEILIYCGFMPGCFIARAHTNHGVPADTADLDRYGPTRHEPRDSYERG